MTKEETDYGQIFLFLRDYMEEMREGIEEEQSQKRYKRAVRQYMQQSKKVKTVKPYNKYKLPDGTYKNFYLYPLYFNTVDEAEKKAKELKNIHRKLNYQRKRSLPIRLYYRIKKDKDISNKTIFRMYLYSTDNNFMKKFRSKRYYN
jgi:hypothetical protein